jgi:hypothetical protein
MQLQPVTATPAAPSVTPTQSPPASQTATLPPTQTQNPAAQNPAAQNPAATQQPRRWPDALSRAHQNAPSAQQPNASSPAAAQVGGANKNAETEGNAADSNRAASAGDQDRAADPRSDSRYGRHSRRHSTFSANNWRNGGDDLSTAPSSRRQDARTYDRNRLYDSYGNRRGWSYGSRPPYGDTFDAAPQPRPQPYGGGGFFRGGPGYYSDY